jgi:pimeloyl-ACP methyl ester carboxylesterase
MAASFARVGSAGVIRAIHTVSAIAAIATVGVLGALAPRSASAAPSPAVLELHDEVHGTQVLTASVVGPGGNWPNVRWDSLATLAVDPGEYEVRFEAMADGPGMALAIPWCAGRTGIAVDGGAASAKAGPWTVPVREGHHDVVLRIRVSPYEQRIACGERPEVGPATRTLEGLGRLRFASPAGARGGGEALVFIPPGHDARKPGALLVGLHPWNGSMWTYASYDALFESARANDVVLLMPSGLGNSLYTADAEDEVLRAIDALEGQVAIDASRVSIWGASMGGAGATTIAFHHPDRFAAVISFFGDSQYDLSTYVHAILPDEAAAHRVNALDIADNARALSVWLIHGESDRTSPIRQSTILASALSQRGFDVRFDRVPGAGHAGALVARFVGEVVARAAIARIPAGARVTYRSVRAGDVAAYGVRFVKKTPRGDAYVDVQRRSDGVHVLAAEGVTSIRLTPGALGTAHDTPPPLMVDAAVPGGAGVDIRWDVR